MSDSAQPSPLPPPSSLQPTVLSKPAAASMPQDEVAQSFSNPPNEITVQSVSSKKQDLQDSKDQDDVFVAGILSIEASPAFKILDQLRNNREISLEKCEILKQKHQTLYQYFLTSFEYEKATLKRVKQLQQDVQKQKVELDKTGTKAFHDNAEIGELKRELLKVSNVHEISFSEERSLNPLVRLKIFVYFPFTVPKRSDISPGPGSEISKGN
ncbi:hypothetical protein BKA69DRAFT_384045 [Paraphysoderma sedebokerense]|nr:hypothetical protein BKA69DRAFT_384045 [Paraphysoderma sedebokerense]